MDLQNRFADKLPEGLDKGLSGYLESLKDALAANNTDLIDYLNKMINDKHAPLMIPRVAIDAAHAQANIPTAASAATTIARLYLQNSATTTSSSIQTGVSYVGRGVLKMAAIMESASGGTAAYNAQLKITIDGSVLYDDAAALGRESAIRVVVGSIAFVDVANDTYAISDDSKGVPFNHSCLIEYKSDGTRTTRAAWKIAKTL